MTNLEIQTLTILGLFITPPKTSLECMVRR